MTIYLGENFADFDLRIVLTMTLGALVLFFALELEDDNLLGPVMFLNGGFDLSVRRGRTGDDLALTLHNGQDPANLDFRSDLARERIDAEDVSRRNAVLLAAGFNNCLHGILSESRTWFTRQLYKL